MIRIIIVDDHPIFRMGMKELLNQERDFSVCGLAEDIAGARIALAKHKPDVALVDISLSKENGLDLVKEIASHHKNIAVLVLSLHDESVWAERAIRAGAKGYVMKKQASASVITAVRNIMDGKIHLSPEIANILHDKLESGNN